MRQLPQGVDAWGRKTNPMLGHCGLGPDGAKCATCVHLARIIYARTYYKCELRRNTHGPATDHRVRWPACGRYEEE
jgi:hypothetical protein